MEAIQTTTRYERTIAGYERTAIHPPAHLPPQRIANPELLTEGVDDILLVKPIPARALILGVVLGSLLWVAILKAAWLILH
jgi:hypothetical protein